MSSIGRKLAQLARTPRGQRLIAQIQRYAARPENRQKIEKLLSRRRAR